MSKNKSLHISAVNPGWKACRDVGVAAAPPRRLSMPQDASKMPKLEHSMKTILCVLLVWNLALAILLCLEKQYIGLNAVVIPFVVAGCGFGTVSQRQLLCCFYTAAVLIAVGQSVWFMYLCMALSTFVDLDRCIQGFEFSSGTVDDICSRTTCPVPRNCEAAKLSAECSECYCFMSSDKQWYGMSERNTSTHIDYCEDSPQKLVILTGFCAVFCVFSIIFWCCAYCKGKALEKEGLAPSGAEAGIEMQPSHVSL